MSEESAMEIAEEVVTEPVTAESVEEVTDEAVTDDVTEPTELSELDEALQEELAKDDGLAEIELDGEIFRVDPKLKDGFLMQKDYTQKTQTLAEQRKTFEAQQLQAQQTQAIQQQTAEARSELTALDMQLKEYEQVDWQAATTQDPETAQAAFMQFQQLKDKRNHVQQNIQMQEAQASQHQQALLAQVTEQTSRQLANEIDGWSQDLAKDIGSYGKEQGLSTIGLNALNSGLHGEDSAPMMKILNKARLYDQMLAKARKTREKKPDIQPVTKVKGNKPTVKPRAKMTTDEWIKSRNKEISRKQA